MVLERKTLSIRVLILVFDASCINLLKLIILTMGNIHFSELPGGSLEILYKKNLCWILTLI